MGDGGVACMPLQQQHNIMERFPITEAFCGSSNGSNSNGFNSKLSFKLGEAESRKKMRPKWGELLKKGEVEKGELGLLEKKNDREVGDVDICNNHESKDEVEEGELGTLKLPGNGEFVVGKKLKSEIGKREAVSEKWRKQELDKGEVAPGKLQKGVVNKGQTVQGKSRCKNNEKCEYESQRDSRDAEKGAFVCERWQKAEPSKDDYSSVKAHRNGRGWKSEHDHTPPSRKCSSEDNTKRKEFSRKSNSRGVRSSRWECATRLSSYKSEQSNGRNHGRDHGHGTNSESIGHKHHGEHGDYVGSKIRRLSDDSNRFGQSEHYSRHSTERSLIDRCSLRHHDLTLPSKVVHDRYGHGRSPGRSNRSPCDRSRYLDRRDHSPIQRERSLHSRWERSPYDRREKSPHERNHSHPHKISSPCHAERTPQSRTHRRDRREQTPSYRERSLLEWSKTCRKNGSSEKQQNQDRSKRQEELTQTDFSDRDLKVSVTEHQNRRHQHDGSASAEKTSDSQSQVEEHIQNSYMDCREDLGSMVTSEEPPSMEEDMDICDTPPHFQSAIESSTGNWFYLDHFGIEHGPSKLSDLKALMEQGVLFSDHLIKHSQTDRWVTVENADSPSPTLNIPSIIPETVTQLVSPPEAPGNLLPDSCDAGLSGNHLDEEAPTISSRKQEGSDYASEPLENLQIDERVEILLKGLTITPGRELEAVAEALQMTFEHPQCERWGNFEGFTWPQSYHAEPCDYWKDELSSFHEITSKEIVESRSALPSDKDHAFSDLADWFVGRWSSKGGDWKRNDEGFQDRSFRRKLVLNDGLPLCQMLKSGHEDPRWHRKDELYHPSQSRRLELPSWAFSLSDERNDCTVLSRPGQNKPVILRGVKGFMSPVVRINACVVKDHGSFVSEPCTRSRGKEMYSSRPYYPYAKDAKNSSVECGSSSKATEEHESESSWKDTVPIRTPKDRVCTVDDLQLHLGDWYYIDGAGHEHGPSLFSEVQVLVDLGTIHKHSSVFRRPDKVWVPVTSYEASKCVSKVQQEDNGISADAFETSALQLQDSSSGGCQSGLTMFHQLYPQFIGYTRGKLHELVMKSYKSREFAAAIKEVLDPWISAKQPKKDAEKYYNSAATSSFQCLSKYQNSEADSSLMDIDQMRASKRSRMSVDVSEDNYERREVLVMVQKDEPTFEDLCGDVVLSKEHLASSAATVRCWGLLNGYLLARVCHFLRADIRSLACASLTCKHWSTAVKFYKNISRHVDLSSIGPMCSDAMVWVIMSGYKREKIVSLVLSGCMNVTSGMLKEILHSFPSLLSVYIGGCPQFEGLIDKYPNVNWMKSQTSHSTVIFDGSFSKIRSLREITEKTSATSKTPENLGSNTDDFDQLKDYFDSVDKREAANQSFRRSLYKRSKVFDARKSSSILSRDARLRRWSVTRSENGYKRMEEFIALTLKDIMKENNFDYFLPKVAEIEGKMKNGYYVGRGLGSVKEDISRMCKDATRTSNRGDAGDMNHIIQLFVQLATCLEESSKSSRKRDEMLKLWKEGSSAGFCATASQYKKKLNKLVNGRKYINRSAGTSFTNGGSDFGEDASYREIRRRLSKLNRKSMDSDSETSNDLERSSDGTSDSKNSYDTESDLDYQSQGCTLGSIEDGYLMGDLSLDSTTEREWGARMTKASLVPPVTRKYEVIDHYVIVADEVDVRRKMRVSLPDDYTEKLNAQKNGSEDMEIPEVKDYKPRKKLGDEVLEQEVYGIDPYTHNLLLDSMPAELEWSQHEKHLFIEDKLLCTLNKQVRNFTGTGNTPMKYPVHPVIEEILKIAEEDCDIQTLRMCQGLLKAIASRPEDSYVSYRKGLGVVCNKPGGFDEDDFVVEFLGEVYPAWKWFEKQDGIRSLQKNSNDPAPEFYNIYLERPKGDGDGYDLVVVDAMHKANYASRICHSCRPNCEAKVTAVDGQYQIGIYSVRKIQYGEEITFDYNSVTESKEEHEASVCLCGSHFCRGSYLNLTGEGAFQKILKEWHGILDRCQLMLEACELNSVSEEDYVDLGRAGLGSCLLGGLPEWLIAYSARLVRFINYERTKLPEEILRRNLEEKRKYFVDVSLEFEKSEAEVQAEGVYNQRLQNLALTLDKVRYVMRCVFGDPKKAPPPLERLGPEAAVSFLWKGEGSLVGELVQYMAPHMEDNTLKDLMFKIRAHDPSCSGNIQKELQRSLLWLRDEVRNLPCNNKCRHDAAADLIHMYAYTNCFLRLRAYKSITSPPVYISSLDLGPKYSDKLGSGLHEYCKTYGENYCLGQLIFWHNQTDGDPDRCLARASRGCLSLPDIGSFYAKVQKPSQQRVYGPRTLKFMLSRMEKQPQKAWPEDRIWSFRSSPEILGSPMLDAVLSNSPLDREMTHWLKNRPAVFQATWDR